MKLLLIQPKTPEKIIGPVIRTTPPYGLMLLATLTPKEFEVEILDEFVDKIDYRKADIVGITVNSPTAKRAYTIADKYRKIGAKVILGGIHPTVLPQEAIKHADSVIIGECEHIWPEILKNFKKGNLKRFYKQKNLTDMSKLPLIDKSYINPKKYDLPYLVQTSRGCPFNCDFCSTHLINGRGIRHTPINNVIDEIEDIIKQPPNLFGRYIGLFTDDNIIADREYAKNLFKAIKKYKVKYGVHWACETTIHLADDEELMNLAYEAGVRVLLIGFESINQDSLNLMRKPHNSSDYSTKLKILKNKGFYVYGQFIFGFDADEKDIFKKTVDWSLKNNMELIKFSVLRVYPGTELYNRLKQEDRLISEVWDTKINVPFKPKNMTREELFYGTKYANLRFYSWGNITRRLFNISTSFDIKLFLYALVHNLEGRAIIKKMYCGGIFTNRIIKILNRIFYSDKIPILFKDLRKIN